MTELDAALVRRKLATITRNIDDLAAVQGLLLEDYQADRFRKKGTERLLQEAIEAAVDANLHILRALERRVPADYYASFIQLGRAGIVTEDLAQRLAPAAGLCNRLVHEYDELDDARVLAAVGTARRDLTEYVTALEGFLEEKGF